MFRSLSYSENLVLTENLIKKLLTENVLPKL